MIPDRTLPETIPAEVLALAATLRRVPERPRDGDLGEGCGDAAIEFTSRNIEAVFGHPYECWVQGRDFWVKHLHPEDRRRTLAA